MGFSIVKGDIFEQRYDAIVVPTQPSLKLEGPMGEQLAKIGGDKLARELKQFSPINIGQCIIVNAYNLPCKRIILVADPKWIDGKHNEEGLLMISYLSCLKMATDFDLDSIAFPLLSTGAYKYPKRDAIEIAINAITKYLEKHEELNVGLMVYTESMFKTYKDIFENYNVVSGHLTKESKEMLESRDREYERFFWYTSNIYDIQRKAPDSNELSLKIKKYMIDKTASKAQCFSGVISQTGFNNILNGSIPKKYTLIGICFNLGLDVRQTQELLSLINEKLDANISKDKIIMRAFNDHMDLVAANKMLTESGHPPLNNLIKKNSK